MTAAKFEVRVSFVVKLMQGWRRLGTVQPDRYGAWKTSVLVVNADRVLALVAETPDIGHAKLDTTAIYTRVASNTVRTVNPSHRQTWHRVPAGFLLR